MERGEGANGEGEGLAAVGALGVPDLTPLLARLDQLEALQLENVALRERLAAQPSHAAPPVPVNVHVRAPTPAPRLGIFTGLKPTGGAEIAFNEWFDRATQYLQEATDDAEACRRVKASLRGIAAEQVKPCTTGDGVLQRLKEIYGELGTDEDLYAQFVKMQMGKGETVADFFSRVWTAFTKLNSVDKYSADDANKKVYHTFLSNAVAADRLIILEIRSEFGASGVASPDPSKVLRRLRELGERTTSTRPTPVTASVSTEIDYDRLATMVAEKMSAAQTANHPPPRPYVPRGPCFRCGEVGHLRRNCRNPPNPAKVAQARGTSRPLNGH